MTSALIEAGTLTASRADRVVSGLLLPFGEIGRTNLGKFSVDPGTFAIPADPSVIGLDVEHDRAQPVGRAITATETPAGIVATFTVARTPEGDRVLDDIETGKRKALSAEVADVVIRAGKAVSGRLFGAAVTVTGAFPSATLLASDVGDPTDAEQTDDPTGDDPTGDADTTDAETGEKKETTMGDTLNASAPADQRRNPPPARQALAGARDLYARLAAAHTSSTPGQLLAALDAIIQADAQPAQENTWLGEIWKSRTYQRRYVPLVAHGTLNSLKSVGWKFTAGKTPTVGDYAGYPAQPTSTETKVEAVEVNAARIAGAAEFDRAFIDFAIPGFWEGFYRELSNDYARKSDAKVPASLAAAATALVPDAVPAGVNTAQSYIVDGIAALLDAEMGLPSYAIVGTNLWKPMQKTREQDRLTFLETALGLEDGTLETFRIIPSSLAAYTSKVLVGIRDAYTFYELPGVPVRVDTVNIANGAGQTGFFGYWAELVNNAAGLRLVG